MFVSNSSFLDEKWKGNIEKGKKVKK